MKSRYAVGAAAVAAILLCIACAETTKTASGPVIHASRFIYDPHAKPVEGAAFVYDAKAPALKASKFVINSL